MCGFIKRMHNYAYFCLCAYTVLVLLYVSGINFYSQVKFTPDAYIYYIHLFEE